MNKNSLSDKAKRLMEKIDAGRLYLYYLETIYIDENGEYECLTMHSVCNKNRAEKRLESTKDKLHEEYNIPYQNIKHQRIERLDKIDGYEITCNKLVEGMDCKYCANYHRKEKRIWGRIANGAKALLLIDEDD